MMILEGFLEIGVQNPRTIDVLGHSGRIQILMFL